MRKLISTIAISLSLITSIFAQQDPEAKKILDALNVKYKAYTSFQANITYKLHLQAIPAISRPSRSVHGHLWS